MILKVLLLLHIYFVNSKWIKEKNITDNQNATIYATFNNKYKNDIEYLFCKILGGSLVNIVKDPLKKFDMQNFTFVDEYDYKYIEGECYYKVNYNETVKEILELGFSRSLILNREFYSMSNSIYFDVDIQIPINGMPIFSLLSINK